MYIWLGGTTPGLQQWARWHSQNRPAITPITPQLGPCLTPYACPSQPVSQAPQLEILTMGSSTPTTCGLVKRGPRLRTTLAAQHHHLHTSPKTHTSATRALPARERNQRRLLRRTARCQRPSPEARLRKRKERHQAYAWRCRGARSIPYWFVQQIIHDLNARRRRGAPRGMGKRREVWTATQLLLSQDVLQADLVITVCRMRLPRTK